MCRAVVAEQAVQGIDAQKHAGRVDRRAVHCVLRRSHRDNAADNVIDLAVHEVVAVRSDHLCGHLVVGFVLGNGVLDVIVKRVASAAVPLDIDRPGVVFEQVAEKHRPFIHVFRGADQLVNQGFTFARRLVGQKRRHIRRCRNAPGQIQVNAAGEFFVGRNRRGSDPVALHPVEKNVVNEVFARDVLRRHQRKFRRLKQGIEVIRKYQEVPDIFCDPDELTQVWINLIDNAIYAIGQQGTLEISIAQQGEFVVVELTNSGDEIPIKIQSHIFDPFFTTKPRGEGSGLGLDIVRQIVQRQGGEIRMQSQPNNTTFIVLLPLPMVTRGQL